jgi:hypothetical protein
MANDEVRERDESVERVRALRQINHLIESGYIPQTFIEDLQRLVKLVQENDRLKKIVAELQLEKAMKQE